MRISTLLGTGAAVTAAAVTGSIATTPAVQSDWYEDLAKPAYQPPRQAFPIVWPALYADIAAVSADTVDELTERGDVAQRRSYIAALLLNLVLNAGWSWLFFNRRRLGPATAVSVALATSSCRSGAPGRCRSGRTGAAPGAVPAVGQLRHRAVRTHRGTESPPLETHCGADRPSRWRSRGSSSGIRNG